MSDEIFRKKSLDKIQSPEDLNDYIRVANPGVWLLLISVIVLLAGVCIWGAFGTVDHAENVEVLVDNGVVSFFTDENSISEIGLGMTVRFGDTEGEVNLVSYNGASGGYICYIAAASVPEDGVYAGKLITESFRPLSFILN